MFALFCRTLAVATSVHLSRRLSRMQEGKVRAPTSVDVSVYGVARVADETRPKNMSVRWIMWIGRA
jgi:hypothetical protein